MSIRKTAIVIGVTAMGVFAFGLLLLDPFNSVQSLSVVVRDGDAGVSPIAANVSRALFVIFVSAAAVFAAWFLLSPRLKR